MARGEPEDGEPLFTLLKRLSNAAIALPLRGDDIEVLRSPDEFFQALMDGLASAQRHITIASLYLGTGGGREAEFAAALAAAAHDPARPQLSIHLVLDALRSTRPTRGGAGVAASEKGDDGRQESGSSGGQAAGAGMTSTAEMLATRLLEGQAGGADNAGSDGDNDGMPGERVRVSLFHTPALRGLLKRVLPPRVSEVIGVMHMKCYAFDDTVIISGANISSTYLSTRQDRYLVLRNAPQLAAFLRQVTGAVDRFSYQLLPAAGQPSAGSRQQQQQVDAQQQGDVQEQQETEPAFSPGQEWGAPAAASGPPHYQHNLPWRLARREPRHHHLQRHRLQRQQRYRLGPCPAGVDPVRHAPAFSQLLRQELLQLFVPRPAWHTVLDFAALEAEAAQAAAEAAAGAAAGAAPAPMSAAAATAAEAAAGAAGAASSQASAPEQEADTWIVPLVQAGFAGLRQEERCTLALLSWATQQQEQQQQQQAGSPASVGSSSFGGAGWAGSWGSAPGSILGAGGTVSTSAAASPSVLLQLASPYLNLARPYEWFLSRQAGSAELELLTSSPEANGFYGSKGLSGYVPLAYSLLEQRTWRRLNRRRGIGTGMAWGLSHPGWSARHGAAPAAGQHTGGSSSLAARVPPSWRRQLGWWEREAAPTVAASGGGTEAASPADEAAASAAAACGSSPARRLLEYCRPGWEFHAKGLWVSLPQQAPQVAGAAAAAEHSAQGRDGCPPGWAAPAVTAVGSSNYGYRSLHRDLEVQFVLVTKNERLRQALAAEVAGLKAHSQAVQGEAHFLAPGRRGGPIARVAVRLLRNFL